MDKPADETKKEELVIPQIKPQENIIDPKEGIETTNSTVAPEKESILIPKEFVGQPDMASSVVETKPQEPNLKNLTPDQTKIKSKTRAKPIILGILGFVLLFIIYLALNGVNIYGKAKALVRAGNGLQTAVASQNIPGIKSEIGNTKTSLLKLKRSYGGVSWLKILPFIGSYIADGQRALKAGVYSLDALDITVVAIEPYVTTLGFGTGAEAEDGEKTTQERIDFVAKAIPSLVPQVEEISGKLALAEKELEGINPDRYPVRVAKNKVREPLSMGLDLFSEVSSFVTKGKPLLEVAPYLLGLDEKRTFLILFQNDKELRPTGGFMTAYSIMDVDKATFEPVSSNDIYNLDSKYKPVNPAPDPIVKYIKGPYILNRNIRLRDMNWSPDFPTVMREFLPEATKVGIGEVDGVIAMDTQLLVNLLEAIGPIGVPGFGNFSTEIEPKCNCPQVIYELESFADVEGPIVWDPVSGKIVYSPPNSDNRKKIIGPLMNSIMANALGQPKEKLPILFEGLFKSLTEKHVLLYLNDEKAQTGVEAFGIAGKIEDFDGDYLHINDANLGGRKSNLYVTQEVEQEYQIQKGEIVKTVTITYKNPEKYDGWLN